MPKGLEARLESRLFVDIDNFLLKYFAKTYRTKVD